MITLGAIPKFWKILCEFIKSDMGAINHAAFGLIWIGAPKLESNVIVFLKRLPNGGAGRFWIVEEDKLVSI